MATDRICNCIFDLGSACGMGLDATLDQTIVRIGIVADGRIAVVC